MANTANTVCLFITLYRLTEKPSESINLFFNSKYSKKNLPKQVFSINTH